MSYIVLFILELFMVNIESHRGGMKRDLGFIGVPKKSAEDESTLSYNESKQTQS